MFGSSAGFAASLDLSALDGTNGLRLKGDAGDVSGWSVAGAGDVNGDGIDDLIIGAPGADPGGRNAAGESYVVFGTAAGFGASLDLSALDGTTGFRLDGIDAFDYSGVSVAGAGDVNGDGIDDLIIGAPGGRDRAGESYVVYGSRQLGGTNDAPVAADDALSVGSLDVVDLAGDNGAGSDHDPDLDDLTVTAIDGVPVTTGDTITLASGLHVTVLGAAEVRFDAAGVPGTSLSDSFVYEISDGRGGSDTATVTVEYRQDALPLEGLDGTNGFRLDGVEAGDFSGYSVAGAGDVNGDGIDDLIVGAPGADPGDRDRAGESYVVFGSALGFAPSLDLAALDGTNGFRLDGIDAYDVSGWSVAGAGDVNGDGIDDLIIGARFAQPGGRFQAGESYVVFGSAAGFAASLDLSALDGANGFRLDGIDAYDVSGFSVAGAGDVNGDGIDDLIIGAGGADYGSGESYVVFGSSAGFAASLDLSALDGTTGFRLDGIDGQSGRSVAGAGDVNGDGIDDLIIGARYADPGGRNSAGESYVVFGSAAGFAASLDLAALDGTNGFRLEGIDEGDQSGVSVAGAGDFNGDGIDDLIIGAGEADPDGRDFAGASYVVFGSAAGFAASLDLSALDGANGFRLDGIDAYDFSGRSVAGAGDVNGDGLDDLIIGAPDADPGGRDGAGESYVVFGFRSGGAGTTAASVAARSDDAEQNRAAGHIELRSHELEIGETAKKLVGLRFTGLDIPDGATITEAYIEFEAARSDARASRITIALEESTSAATFGRGDGRISARPYLDETTSWSPEAWVKGGVYRTADLTETIAALIGTEGLDLDEALAFRFKGKGEREAASFESSGAAPKLVINFETGPPNTPPVPVDDLADQIPGSPLFIDALADHTDPSADSFRFLDAMDDARTVSAWDDLVLA